MRIPKAARHRSSARLATASDGHLPDRTGSPCGAGASLKFQITPLLPAPPVLGRPPTHIERTLRCANILPWFALHAVRSSAQIPDLPVDHLILRRPPRCPPRQPSPRPRLHRRSRASPFLIAAYTWSPTMREDADAPTETPDLRTHHLRLQHPRHRHARPPRAPPRPFPVLLHAVLSIRAYHLLFITSY